MANLDASVRTSPQSLSHDWILDLRVQQFLFKEAALLDEWQLAEWLELFTLDARYVIPCTDFPAGDHSSALVLLDDDYSRLSGRVTRLSSRRAYREFPSSRTRRLISNIVIQNVEEQGLIHVSANFIVYRFRGDTACYVGKYHYLLEPHGDTFRIRFRRAELDQEALWDHGTISIIL